MNDFTSNEEIEPVMQQWFVLLATSGEKRRYRTIVKAKTGQEAWDIAHDEGKKSLEDEVFIMVMNKV